MSRKPYSQNSKLKQNMVQSFFFFSLFVNTETQSFNKDENVKFLLLSTLTNHTLRRIHVSGIGPSRKLSPAHSHCAYTPIQLLPAALKCYLSSCSRREGLSLSQGHRIIWCKPCSHFLPVPLTQNSPSDPSPILMPKVFLK